MRWHIQGVLSSTQSQDRLKEIVRIILAERGIENQEEFVRFLKPPSPSEWDYASLGISLEALSTLKVLIEGCKAEKKEILVYGDYDADGVTATAILHSTLTQLGLDVIGYIPDRRSEGYGMKVDTLAHLIEEHPNLGLVITVDQGIVAFESAEYLKKLSIPLVITDHHQPGNKTPQAEAIIHTTLTSGSGVAWIVSQYLLTGHDQEKKLSDAYLELATIGTVADLLPLIDFNRSLVTHGITCLRKTQHVGIQALLRLAKIPVESLDTYHISYLLAPRINAMGRMTHALQALQLLTEQNDLMMVSELAEKLEATNRQRQDVTEELLTLALSKVATNHKLLFIEDEAFDEGVVGLIAGKLVEKYHRPSVVLSIQNGIAKASARSIKPFNMVDFLRMGEDLMEGVGGHAMAAGFSVKTENVPALKKRLLEIAEASVEDAWLEPTLGITCELQFEDITWYLWRYLESLAPYGIENQRPVFATLNVRVNDVKTFGLNDKHLRLWLEDANGKRIVGVGFNLGSYAGELIPGMSCINIAYTLSENTWRNKRSLELQIKDLQIISS